MVGTAGRARFDASPGGAGEDSSTRERRNHFHDPRGDSSPQSSPPARILAARFAGEDYGPGETCLEGHTICLVGVAGGSPIPMVWWYHATMAKNFTVRLPDDEAADIEALARAEGLSLNETVRTALVEAIQKRRADPEFKARVRRIIKEDRELLERLAR